MNDGTFVLFKSEKKTDEGHLKQKTDEGGPVKQLNFFKPYGFIKIYVVGAQKNHPRFKKKCEIKFSTITLNSLILGRQKSLL